MMIRSLEAQKGQALIYGIFLLLCVLTAFFFLFNTGQLAKEKTKLVNTSDAVAYSAGVMQARALNYDAYNNRALIANEVVTAQMVSVASWSQFAKTKMQNLGSIHPECYSTDGTSNGVGAMLKYRPKYGFWCAIAAQTIGQSGGTFDNAMDATHKVAERAVEAANVTKTVITEAQDFLHTPAFFESMRGNVMREVADANYANDGTVTVEPLNMINGMASLMNDDWKGFTKKYSGDERVRFRDLSVYAANTDSFVPQRKWTSKAPIPTPECFPWAWKKNSVKRRGGTELIGFDEWKAADTESFHRWKLRKGKRIKPKCVKEEKPTGYGVQEAYAANQGDGGKTFGGAKSDNPSAYGRASSTSWGYSGIPSYYDLSEDWLSKTFDPRMKFGVRVVRQKSEVRTSDGASQIKTTADSRINGYNSNLAKSEMSAVSTTEVFFERPASYRENVYAQNKMPSRTMEIGSLFNPYWQVRMIHSDKDVNLQRARQMQ